MTRMRLETPQDVLRFTRSRALPCDLAPDTTPALYTLQNPQMASHESPQFWAEPRQIRCVCDIRVVMPDGTYATLSHNYGTTARTLYRHDGERPLRGFRGWPERVVE